jgi:outer membrane lipoprotein-sorting protein
VADKREVDIVSVFRSRPALRWIVPSAAAVVVLGGGAVAGTMVASADSSLPDRSAAQLLVDIQGAKVDGFSGTVVESADLGLPAIASAVAGQAGGELTSLLAGSNTARVWYAGESRSRLALLGTNNETDVVRNGSDVWLWRSSDNTATHVTVPAGSDAAKKPSSLAGGVPATPQEAADQALASISPTTKVTTTGAAKVAGRDAYELVLSPKDGASLVGQVRLAIDAEKHIPLRVDVYAKNATSPAVRVAFQQITFAVPDAAEFTFNPPAGAKITNTTPQKLSDERQNAVKAHAAERSKVAKEASPQVIGKGWTSVVHAKLPKTTGKDSSEVTAALTMLPKVSGTWGSGRLLSGSLFSVLVTDDGQVYGGLVTPETLYQAAAK